MVKWTINNECIRSIRWSSWPFLPYQPRLLSHDHTLPAVHPGPAHRASPHQLLVDARPGMYIFLILWLGEKNLIKELWKRENFWMKHKVTLGKTLFFEGAGGGAKICISRLINMHLLPARPGEVQLLYTQPQHHRVLPVLKPLRGDTTGTYPSLGSSLQCK